MVMVTDARATEAEGENESEGGAPARRRAPTKAPGGDDKVQQSIRLSAELRDALKAHADREGIAVNEACTRAIEGYLTGAATGQLAEVAAPLVAEAARQGVAAEVKEVKQLLASLQRLQEATWRAAARTSRSHPAARAPWRWSSCRPRQERTRPASVSLASSTAATRARMLPCLGWPRCRRPRQRRSPPCPSRPLSRPAHRRVHRPPRHQQCRPPSLRTPPRSLCPHRLPGRPVP